MIWNKKVMTLLSVFLLSFSTSLFAQKTNNSVKKYIYLTFDDGPLNGSDNIDEVFKNEKLKVTVFLVGEHVEKNKTMTDYFKYYEDNPYIEECNHSWTHANDQYKKFYSNEKTSVADILKNQSTLKLQDKIVRLPGRNMWRLDGKSKNDGASGVQTADGLAKLGYKVIGWDLEWAHHAKDGTPVQSVQAIYKQIVNQLESNKTFTKNNIVVLIHDEMFQNKWEESELKQLVDLLKKHDNYIFEQIKFYPQ